MSKNSTKKRWTKEEEDFLRENSKTMSYQELATSLGRTKNGVSKRVRQLNLEIKNTFNKYEYNVNYFSEIDTAEKAYWLGFIAADGCLLEKGRLKIGLQGSDSSHLEKFNRALESNKKVKMTVSKKDGKSYPSALLVFDSVKMASDLKKANIFPLKTYDMKFPNIKNELMPHYLRGLFDGDGSFYIGNRKDRNRKYFSVELIGYNSPFMLEVQDFLKNQGIDINWYLKRESTAKLSVSNKKDCLNLIEYLYCGFQHEVVCLERKKVKALEIRAQCLV